MTDDIKTKVSEWRPSLYKTAAFILDSDKISSVDKKCLEVAIGTLKFLDLIAVPGPFANTAKDALAEIEKIRGRE